MITVTGSINMDLVVRTPHIPQVGETVLAQDFRQNPGGKGANQAVAAARLGSRVSFVGCLGTDSFGDALAEGLARDGIDITHVRRTEQVSSGLALIQVDGQGRNNIAVVPGANYALTCGDIDAARPLYARSKAALFQLEIPLEVTRYALEAAKQAGCLTILNPAPAQALPRELLRWVDILAPNEVELSALTDMPCDTLEQVRAAAGALAAESGCRLVVTLGARGVFHMEEGVGVHYHARPVQAVDTTAAGDSFLGGLAHCLETGAGMAQSIDFGQRVASYAVRRPGAQPSLPTRAQLEGAPE